MMKLEGMDGASMASSRKKRASVTLKELLRDDDLDELAGGRSYERGEEYFESGAVETLTQYGQRLSAVVHGTYPYKAAIWIEDGVLDYDCSCPVDDFCKHLVAVALAFRAGKTEVLDADASEAPPPTRAEKKAKGSRTPNLRTHLMAQPQERLVGWLLEMAARDGAFLERLKLDAATANPAGVDMDDFRRRIDKGLDFPEDSYDYHHYGHDEDGGAALERFEPVLKALETIFAQGNAIAVASLLEYALTEFGKVAHRLAHDPDAVGDIMQRLCALHGKALRSAKPNPVALAEWIFNRALAVAPAYGGFPWEIYRPVLDTDGMKRFRERVEAAWDKVPAKTANDRSYDGSGERRWLKSCMVAFTEADGDVDARAAVERKDLSSPYQYLELARVYQKAKRHDEALSWAEKGWNAFPEPYNRHPGLRAFLAAEYRRRKRIDDAMTLYWTEFMRAPALSAYQELKKQADLDRTWPTWREKAMTRLREDIESKRQAAEKQKAARGWWSRDGDRSRMVEIFLWERNPGAAWQEAAEGGCSEELWLQLAKGREKSHPADCVPIWRRRVERLTLHANQSNYAPAAESLKKLGQLMERTGQAKAFTDLMAEIRLARKARRNFVAELDRLHLP